MAHDENPPSFAPRGRPQRPNPAGARTVGSGTAPAVRPGPPAAPARTASSAPARAVPPSTPARPAAGSHAPHDEAPRAIPVAGRSDVSARPSGGRTASSVPAGGARTATGGRPVTDHGPSAGAPRVAGVRPPVAPHGTPRTAPPPSRPGTPTTSNRPARRRRRVLVIVALVLIALLAWPVGLLMWSNGKTQHTSALSGAANTPGTTYLLTGSDERGADGIGEDGTEGARTDTILLLQVPDDGPTALISLPRDTYVDIPGYGPSKLNAAFAWGGAPLLVQTVESLTGLTVDHYAEIGMGGVKEIVDAVGGVNLCYDADVNDADSGMVWTAGCHDVGGDAALAFARMRKADPEGDIGRAQRQRQLISAVMAKVKPTSLLLNPGRQVELIDAGTGALTVDEKANLVDLGKLALAFRAANGPDGITGTPPIKSLDYRPGSVGSTVLLDPDATPTFFAQIRDGALPAGQVGGVTG